MIPTYILHALIPTFPLNLFLNPKYFLRANLEENCQLRETVNVQGQISQRWLSRESWLRISRKCKAKKVHRITEYQLCMSYELFPMAMLEKAELMFLS